MIMDLNTRPSLFSIVPSNYDDQDQEHHPFGPNNQVSSSSSSSWSFFRPIQDKKGCFQHHLSPLQNDHKDHKCAYDGGSSTWKKEDRGAPSEIEWKKDGNPVKLMSSKMNLMQKMKKKNHDGLGLKPTSNGTRKKSSYLGTYLSNNNLSYDNTPIRVCVDCNTTKTPLWRSGPKGPKSLCNACGIKQRKARRAAMAAPAANVAVVAADQKLEKSEANIAAGSITNGQKKLGFEELLINLGKNLTFHRVFPDDEKDAAILLMALSSGLLHG